jgi:hypothetical protein
MTTRAAIKILIQSPLYFRMDVSQRLALAQEFCRNHFLQGGTERAAPIQVPSRTKPPRLSPGPGSLIASSNMQLQ